MKLSIWWPTYGNFIRWAGPPVEWVALPVSPTLPYLPVSKLCFMQPGHRACRCQSPATLPADARARPSFLQMPEPDHPACRCLSPTIVPTDARARPLCYRCQSPATVYTDAWARPPCLLMEVCVNYHIPCVYEKDKCERIKYINRN